MYKKCLLICLVVANCSAVGMKKIHSGKKSDIWMPWVTSRRYGLTEEFVENLSQFKEEHKHRNYGSLLDSAIKEFKQKETSFNIFFEKNPCHPYDYRLCCFYRHNSNVFIHPLIVFEDDSTLNEYCNEKKYGNHNAISTDNMMIMKILNNGVVLKIFPRDVPAKNLLTFNNLYDSAFTYL